METKKMQETLATKVMGWTKSKDFRKFWIDRWLPIELPAALWQPDLDWQQYGMIIEAMRKQGWNCTVDSTAMSKTQVVYWRWRNNEIVTYSVTDKDERYARMLCAARALESEANDGQ